MRQAAVLALLVGLGCAGDDGSVEGTSGPGSTSATAPSTSTTEAGTSTGAPTPDTDPSTGESSSTAASTGTGAESSSSGEPLVCGDVNADGPSFVDTVWPILEDRCDGGIAAICHQNGTVVLELGLDMEVAYGNLVCVEARQAPLFRVNPGDPDGSYVLGKLRGEQIEIGGMGMRMPLSADPLTDEELATIEAWILGGAAP